MKRSIRQGPSPQKQNKKPLHPSLTGETGANSSLQDPVITTLGAQREGATQPSPGFQTRCPIRDDCSAIWRLSKKGKGIPNRSVGPAWVQGNRSHNGWTVNPSMGECQVFHEKEYFTFEKSTIVFRTLTTFWVFFLLLQQAYPTETLPKMGKQEHNKLRRKGWTDILQQCSAHVPLPPLGLACR